MAEFVTISQEVIDAQIERWRGVMDALAPLDGPVCTHPYSMSMDCHPPIVTCCDCGEDLSDGR